MSNSLTDRPPLPEPDWILEVRQWLQDRGNTYAAAVSAADNAALTEQLQAMQSELIRATNFELDAGRVMRHEQMLNGFEDLRVIEAEFVALRERVAAAEQASRWESDLCEQALQRGKVLEDALREAADEIERLRAENEALQAKVTEHCLQALAAETQAHEAYEDACRYRSLGGKVKPPP